MKRMLKYLYLIGILCILEIPTSYAASNPYPEKTQYGTNCTWYVWNQVYTKKGIALPKLGNAKDWMSNAKKQGFEVGTTPRTNSIAVWNLTEWGHVGYVEKAEGSKYYTWDAATTPCYSEESQEKYKECIFSGLPVEDNNDPCLKVLERVACLHDAADQYDREIIGFIYLDKIPNTQDKAETPKKDTTTKTETPKKEEIKKSNNSYLNKIELSTGTIDFNKNTLKYNLEVEYEVEEIEINAVVESELATVTNTGITKLNVGLNEIKLIVTAEDKTTKEYKLNITRKEEVKKEEQKDLSSIKIDNKENESKKDNKVLIISSIIGGSLIIITLGIIIIKKFKKNKKSSHK